MLLFTAAATAPAASLHQTASKSRLSFSSILKIQYDFGKNSFASIEFFLACIQRNTFRILKYSLFHLSTVQVHPYVQFVYIE